MRTRWGLVVGLSMLLGCSAMKGVVSGPTQKYAATLSAQGAVVLGPLSLGTFDVPQTGAGLLNLIVDIVGPALARSANLKSCTFTAYPETVTTAIVVTATAACQLNGQPVAESVSVTLAPVPS